MGDTASHVRTGGGDAAALLLPYIDQARLESMTTDVQQGKDVRNLTCRPGLSIVCRATVFDRIGGLGVGNIPLGLGVGGYSALDDVVSMDICAQGSKTPATLRSRRQ